MRVDAGFCRVARPDEDWLDRRRKILWRMLGVMGLAVCMAGSLSLAVGRAPSAYPFPVTMLRGRSLFVLWLRNAADEDVTAGTL